MAISLVGSAISGTAINGGDVTLDLTTIATLAENDVVYVLCGTPRVAAGAGTSSSGWTSISGPHDNTSVRTQVFRKVMGATPDTSFVATGTANVSDGTIAVAIALRGVDTTTPEDATPVSKTDTASTNPDPSAIVTVTANAWVVVMAASASNDAAVIIPSGYGNGHSNTVNDTRPISGSVATILEATAGSEDPPSWTSWNTARWGAYTIAVRPASVSPTGTIAQTITKAAQSASGTETFTGTAANAQIRAAQAGSGTVANPVTGTAEQTITKAAQAAVAAEAFTGTAAQTITKAAQDAAGTAGSAGATGTAEQTAFIAVQAAVGTVTDATPLPSDDSDTHDGKPRKDPGETLRERLAQQKRDLEEIIAKRFRGETDEEPEAPREQEPEPKPSVKVSKRTLDAIFPGPKPTAVTPPPAIVPVEELIRQARAAEAQRLRIEEDEIAMVLAMLN
jgi:hypothetical protein